jgi:hypothetical protein
MTSLRGGLSGRLNTMCVKDNAECSDGAVPPAPLELAACGSMTCCQQDRLAPVPAQQQHRYTTQNRSNTVRSTPIALHIVFWQAASHSLPSCLQQRSCTLLTETSHMVMAVQQWHAPANVDCVRFAGQQKSSRSCVGLDHNLMVSYPYYQAP